MRPRLDVYDYQELGEEEGQLEGGGEQHRLEVVYVVGVLPAMGRGGSGGTLHNPKLCAPF